VTDEITIHPVLADLLTSLGIDPAAGPLAQEKLGQLLAGVDRLYQETDRGGDAAAPSLRSGSGTIESPPQALQQSFSSRQANESSLLQSLVDSIPDLIFYKDRGGSYLGCNRAFEAYVGRGEKELAGRTDSELFDTKNSENSNRREREVLTLGKAYRNEEWSQYPDGRKVLLDTLKTPFYGPDGEVLGLIGISRDITGREHAEEKLRQAATVFQSANESIMITGADGIIAAVNQAFTRIMGFSEEEVLGENPRKLRSGRHDEAFYQAMWDAIKEEGSWHGQIWNQRKDGSVVPGWQTISAVKDESGKVTHYVGVFADISDFKRSQAQLDHLAHHDPLTNLPNRLLFVDRLEHALDKARRDNSLCALLFLDLDRFKKINDTLGHPAGDEVLQIMSRRLRKSVRASDTVARLGGDEYVVIVPELEASGDAALVARKILDSVAEPFTLATEEVYVSVSIGIAAFPQDATDAMTLIKHADAAMYRAKDQGRNNYQFYTPELTAMALEHFAMDSSLRKALQRQEFVLSYQPQLSLSSRTIVGAEALISWQHPDLGRVPPDKFIPLAEETGVIIPIGDWVLREACQQIRQWHEAGFENLTMSVNLSGRQVMSKGLVERIKRILDQTGAAPGQIKLEITESSVMERAETSTKTLEELRSLGIRLSMDDFGTGYSSMTYLKRFSIDELKIDRSFIQEIPQNENDVAITRAVIALGRSLEIDVVAEGVETDAQLGFLKSEGCDRVQGFICSPPLGSSDFLALLQGMPASI